MMIFMVKQAPTQLGVMKVMILSMVEMVMMLYMGDRVMIL